MLKIKDNIDLKILKKYGFTYDDSNGIYEYRSINSRGLSIKINSWNRKLYMFSNTNYLEDEDIFSKLYDLIKDGLVEKVKDK